MLQYARLLIAVLIILGSTNLKAQFLGNQSAELLDQGEVWIEVGGAYNNIRQLYGLENLDYVLNREVSSLQLRAHASYGFLPRWNVFASLPYGIYSSSEELRPEGNLADSLISGSLNWFGNTEFGIRYALLEQPDDVFLSFSLRFAANNSDLDQRLGLQTGWDAWTIEPIFHFSKLFEKSVLNLDLSMPIRNRDHSESVKADFEYAYRWKHQSQVGIYLGYLKSFDNGDDKRCNLIHSGLFPDRLEYLVYGLQAQTMIYRSWGLRGGIYQGISGDLFPKSPQFQLALFVNFRPFPPKSVGMQEVN